MSKEEELFKQHLDAMLSSQPFEMGADNWSGMELLLKQQKRKRRAFFILFTGIGVLLLGSLLWLFMPQTQSSNTTIAAKTSVEPIAEPLRAQINAKGQEITPPSIKEVEPALANEPATFTVKSQTAVPVKPDAENLPHTQKKSADVFTSQTSPLKLNAAPPAGTTEINGGLLDDVSKNDPFVSTPITKPNNNDGKVKDKGKVEVPIIPSVPEATVNSVVSESQNEIKVEETTETKIVSQVDTSIVSTTDSASQTRFLKPDTAVALVAKPDTDYVSKKQLSYLFEAGITALSGWQENNKRDAAGINPLLGAHISYPLAPDLEVAIGLQYTTVGHLKYSSYTATTSRLDLGRVDQSLVFTPTRLHYLLVPMQVSLKLDDKQSLGGGISFGYLLTAESKVEAYTYDNFGSTLIRTEKKKGYTEGFRNMDAQISAHYKYRFAPNLQAQLCLMFGLMDVKTGVALPSKGFERNSGAKISLLYTLFGK